MNSPIEDVISSYPRRAQSRIQALRKMVHDVAGRITGIGELEETLKWGEPAFLTTASRSGTTVRLAWHAKEPDHYSMFVSCQTTLLDQYRALFPELDCVGNRQVRLPLDRTPPACLRDCIALALTYKKPQLLQAQTPAHASALR